MKALLGRLGGSLLLACGLALLASACAGVTDEDPSVVDDALKKKCKDKDDDKKKEKKKDKDDCKDETKGGGTTSTIPAVDPKYAGKGAKHAFCNAASYAFSRKLPFEAGLPAAKTADLRPFRWATFGKVTLAMGPVGKSDTGAVKALAKELARTGTSPASLRSCTYFFNMTEDKTAPAAAYDVADKTAEDNLTFNWSYVSNPAKQPNLTLLASEYDALAAALFSSAPKATFKSPLPAGQKDPFVDNREVIPLARCAEETGVLVMGCDSNHHRGPTVEGRVLAMAGCTPEDAYATVDTLWGDNGVPPAVRMKIIEQGVEDRTRYPAASAKLAALLGAGSGK